MTDSRSYPFTRFTIRRPNFETYIDNMPPKTFKSNILELPLSGVEPSCRPQTTTDLEWHDKTHLEVLQHQNAGERDSSADKLVLA